jgi:hypothetical protein
MALNLSALSDAANKVTALGNLILVSPQKTVGYQPQNSPSWKRDTTAQPKAILFNYSGEEAIQLTSEITDHPIENNTMVQDQIALKPVIFTVQGFVGELNDIAPAALVPLKEAAEKLTVISAYTPSLSTTALLAYTNAFQAYQIAQGTINSAVETWSSINGDSGQSVINGGGLQIQPNQTQQQIYFQQFYAYFQNRTLFTIQTPWAIFQDMAIERLRAVQSAETRMITDFEIQFKLLRFASTQSVLQTSLYDNNNFQGRAFNQGAPEVDLGTNTLEPSTTSFTSVIA